MLFLFVFVYQIYNIQYTLTFVRLVITVESMVTLQEIVRVLINVMHVVPLIILYVIVLIVKRHVLFVTRWDISVPSVVVHKDLVVGGDKGELKHILNACMNLRSSLGAFDFFRVNEERNRGQSVWWVLCVCVCGIVLSFFIQI